MVSVEIQRTVLIALTGHVTLPHAPLAHRAHPYLATVCPLVELLGATIDRSIFYSVCLALGG